MLGTFFMKKFVYFKKKQYLCTLNLMSYEKTDTYSHPFCLH
jgi:hypothetical protein